MRADELMIGDWVQNTCGVRFQVAEILEDGVNGERNCEDYDHIEPIPIDEDILEANGWRKKKERLYDLEGRLIEKSGTTWYMYVSEKAMLRYDPISIMYYVHELQNLLRVTNYGKAEMKL